MHYHTTTGRKAALARSPNYPEKKTPVQNACYAILNRSNFMHEPFARNDDFFSSRSQ